MNHPLRSATGRDHKVCVVLGSGLSALASALVGGDPIPFSRIEGMPGSAVAGHEGAVYSGDVDGVPTIVFAGRVHLYEGHDVSDATFGVRSAVLEGCGIVVLTNAAGAINPGLEVGSPVLISDHINLTGRNPLVGPHDGLGPRFLDQSEAWDRELRAIAKSIDPDLQEGVYAGLLGPTYETPAEVRMLRALGADLVGMSTVVENIAARYLGARVLGLSLVTNQAAGLSPKPLSHEEVALVGARGAERLEKLLRGFLQSLPGRALEP